METLAIVFVVGAFLFNTRFRKSVNNTLDNANRTIEVANTAISAGLDEIEQSLPKANIPANPKGK